MRLKSCQWAPPSDCQVRLGRRRRRGMCGWLGDRDETRLGVGADGYEPDEGDYGDHDERCEECDGQGLESH